MSTGDAAKNRKRPLNPPAKEPNRNAKRARTFAARNLLTQSTNTAFANGELDVSKFVRAREFEIKALEDGITKAKGALARRAFQDVPRELRRRTASHDAKRVPERLRRRAKDEMKEDNTPTVNSRTKKKSGKQRLRVETAKRLRKLGEKAKLRRDEEKERKADSKDDEKDDSKKPAASTGATVQPRKAKAKKAKLAIPPTPAAKFRRRQIHKSWLPTHMFHTKRAHMTESKAPLWRFAIPVTPTAKCYRTTHRAGTLRGAVAWDMSYMATISVSGVQKSVEGLLKALGVGESDEGLWGKQGKRWRAGLRAWSGWMHERQKYPLDPIGPVTVIWCALDKSLEADDAGANEKGSHSKRESKRKAFIRVHPAAFMQLWEQAIRLGRVQKPEVSIEDLRFEIGSIEIAGPGSTEALVSALPAISPSGEISLPDSPQSIFKSLPSLSNPASLPRNALLGFDASDPRLRHPPRTVPYLQDPGNETRLLEIMTTWPVDSTQTAPKIFDRAARLAASRCLSSQKSINRRKSLATPGSYPTPRPADPKIPVLLYTSSLTPGGQASWTILLPWKCVLPVWHSIVFYPLSTGGNPRFGGLNEYKQLAFERCVPWFPGDFPGTPAGDLWEKNESEKAKAAWEGRPKGKRVEFDSLDLGGAKKGEIGDGWACDWQRLATGVNFCGSKDQAGVPIVLKHVPSSISKGIVDKQAAIPPKLERHSLMTVSITPVGRGVFSRAARIYRLPTKDTELRSQWKALLSSSESKPKHELPRPPPPNAPVHVKRRFLALSLLTPSEDAVRQPAVPSEEDLVGFVTTGGFNLGEGNASAIGSILLDRVVASADEKRICSKLCIVRDAGQAVGRLARWEVA